MSDSFEKFMKHERSLCHSNDNKHRNSHACTADTRIPCRQSVSNRQSSKKKRSQYIVRSFSFMYTFLTCIWVDLIFPFTCYALNRKARNLSMAFVVHRQFRYEYWPPQYCFVALQQIETNTRRKHTTATTHHAEQ